MKREYNNNLIEMRGPHELVPGGITSRMVMVMIALIPTFLMGCFVFGARCVTVTAFCMLLCLVLEIVTNTLLKKSPRNDDLTCLITGLIIALNMPANVPLWIAAVGCFVAIVLVKGPFRKRRNIVNPACAGIIVIYAAFRGFMDLWPAPRIGSPSIPADAVLAPSWLDVVKGAEGSLPTNWEMFLGFTPGAIGCVCTIAIIVGAAFLIWRKLINVLIPLSVIGTCAVIAFIASEDPVATITSGGIMMGACMMATDPVTSPTRMRAMTIYGIGIGLITMVIRLTLPVAVDGIYIAILVMNLTSSRIDRFFIMEEYKSAGPIMVRQTENKADRREDDADKQTDDL